MTWNFSYWILFFVTVSSKREIPTIILMKHLCYAQNIGKFQMFVCYLTILYQFNVVKWCHIYFTFFKNHAIIKVDVLPFLNVYSNLGLAIVRKFEKGNRFPQLLVGKPTLAKLHMIEADEVVYPCTKRKIWTSFSCSVI